MTVSTQVTKSLKTVKSVKSIANALTLWTLWTFDFTDCVLTALTPCRHMVSDLFHRPSGLLFTFPSRYLFTIGLEKYLDLPVSSGGFPRAFRVPGYLRIETKEFLSFSNTGLSPARAHLSR